MDRQLFLATQKVINLFIEIGNNLLSLIEFKILRFRFLLSVLARNQSLAMVRENIVTAERRELIDAGGKLFHRKGVLPRDKVFNLIEIPGHSPLQSAYIFLFQIVLGDGYVGLQDSAIR